MHTYANAYAWHRIESDRIGSVGMSGESNVLFAKQQEQQCVSVCVFAVCIMQ